MVKKSDFWGYVKYCLGANTFADIGKYSSLVYGIANVVGDEPHIDRAIGAGVVYVVSGLIGLLAKGCSTEAAQEPLRETLDTIAEKLDVHKE